MKVYENSVENSRDDAYRRFACPSVRRHWPAAVLAGVALAGALVPRAPAAVALVVVDVAAVADGYRFSKLRGQAIYNSTSQKIGELDDLIVGKDRVLFAIVQVGGFLGIGSRLVAVPYTSLQISQQGKQILLPGATKEQLQGLPEFVYQ
jgi:sporulation protein YlmC with PRC-barrel domain